LDGVDIMRGLAIFFVLMNHVNMRLFLAKIPYAASLPHQFRVLLLWNGQRGVQMFFAVSGFLITATALRRWGSPSQVSLRGFYLLRFARIVPLLLLLLAILSALHLAGVTNFVIAAKTGGLPQALFAALSFHLNLLEAQRGYLPANWDILWSLSVEETFYLFFPLVCRLLGRGKLLIVFLLAIVALGPLGRTVFTHGNEVWQEYSYLGGMDAIALGCLTALIAARRSFSRRQLASIATAGATLMLFILCFSIKVYHLGLEDNGLSMSILALGTCMVTLAAAQSQWRAPRAFSPLLMLGRRSYEIYLTHMFVVFAFFTVFLRMGKPSNLIPWLFVAVLLFSAALGELVARYFSEPMNRHLRARWGKSEDSLTSVVASTTKSETENELAPQ